MHAYMLDMYKQWLDVTLAKLKEFARTLAFDFGKVRDLVLATTFAVEAQHTDHACGRVLGHSTSLCSEN